MTINKKQIWSPEAIIPNFTIRKMYNKSYNFKENKPRAYINFIKYFFYS